MQAALSLVLMAVACLLLSSCHSSKADSTPSIEITRIPAAGEGRPDKLEAIEGRAKAARPDQRIVLFARSGVWWLQPWANQPFTTIQPDSTWKNLTHPGDAYAALLVDSQYRPPLTIKTLPGKGDSVLAVATVEGVRPTLSSKTLQFSGYKWDVREFTGDPGGTASLYDSANAWTDKQGFLHLHIARRPDGWTSAEVQLSWSLGYGSYRFVVRDVSHLEPAVVLTLGPPREMDIQISRWGESEDKNAQYVIQPYVVPTNTVRFTAPQGTLTYWMSWEPGRVVFKTVRGSSSNMKMDAVSEHAFTSGVPSPGKEKLQMNLHVFENKRNPLRNEAEVIIEKFEFRP